MPNLEDNIDHSKLDYIKNFMIDYLWVELHTELDQENIVTLEKIISSYYKLLSPDSDTIIRALIIGYTHAVKHVQLKYEIGDKHKLLLEIESNIFDSLKKAKRLR